MATDANDSACNIKVVCRVRPLNELEKRNGYGNIVKTSNDDGVNIQVGVKIMSYIRQTVQSVGINPITNQTTLNFTGKILLL